MPRVRSTSLAILSLLLLAGGATSLQAKCKGDCTEATKTCSEVSPITTTRTPTRFEIEVDWCDEETIGAAAAPLGSCSTLTQKSEGTLAGISSCFHAGTFKERIVERMPIRVHVKNFNHFAYQLDIDATEEENKAYTKLLGWWQALGLETLVGITGAADADRRGCATFDEVLSSWTAQTAVIARAIPQLLGEAGVSVALTTAQRAEVRTKALALRGALAGGGSGLGACDPNADNPADEIEVRRGDWTFNLSGLEDATRTQRVEARLTVTCIEGTGRRHFVDILQPHSAADRERAAGAASRELENCDHSEVDTPTLPNFVSRQLSLLVEELDPALTAWEELRTTADPCCPSDPMELRELALSKIRSPEDWDRFEGQDARFRKIADLARALLAKADLVEGGMFTDHRVLGLKLAAGTMVTVNFQASPVDDDPEAPLLSAIPSQSFSPFDVGFFVESKQPVVFHLGLAARKVNDLSVDQILDVGETNLVVVDDGDFAGALTAFLSVRLLTLGKAGNLTWLASLGTDSDEPGQNLYLSPLTLNWKKIFLTVGATSVEALKVDGTLSDPDLSSLRSARDWEPFIAVTFDALGRWRR